MSKFAGQIALHLAAFCQQRNSNIFKTKELANYLITLGYQCNTKKVYG